MVGEKEGEWLKNWLVIGYEDCCGDPIFIDTAHQGFPVYSAMHGEGSWEAIRIADSLEGLGHALSAVVDVSKGRENPVALENNLLNQHEKELTLATIKRYNPNADLDFWETMLSG